MVVTGGAAMATPSASVEGGIGVQCTRQYVVTAQTISLRSSPGGAPTGVVGITGDKFNVPNPSGSWYAGNLYDQYNTYLGYGWTLASNLAYTGTCF
jgi:hypothetical protein